MGPRGKYAGYQVKHATDSHNRRGSSGASGAKGLDKFLTVYNDSPRTIVVKDRFGVCTFLKPRERKSGTAGTVMFKLQWYLDADSARYTLEDLERRYPKPSRLIETMIHAFSDALLGMRQDNLVTTTPIWVDVPVIDLMDAGGRLYIEELDYTICIAEAENEKIDHPMSTSERARNVLPHIVPPMGRNTMFFMIKAVDNGKCKTRNDRYMWIGGEVYHIPVEHDSLMDDGIHVVCQPPASMKNQYGGHAAQPLFMRYTFEEADEVLGLSPTIEAAKHRGNAKDALTERATMLTFESKMKEMELTRQLSEERWQRDMEKLEFDKQRAIADKELADARHQKELEKLEADAARMAWESTRREQEFRKAEQDLRREEVRNFAEWMRLAGTVITAGLALASLAQKIKPVLKSA